LLAEGIQGVCEAVEEADLIGFGLMMLNELALQLRDEAGDLQVPGARVGLVENGGGFIGTDAAVCAVTILERTQP
jgi:hypothetical protein